mmetsp:Transcript_80497/g.232634  ORF Transcript_80497/g.232634 Transcript_80497/m.232634 type:complete len:172 (-) Transcript_80497:483-998(-)
MSALQDRRWDATYPRRLRVQPAQVQGLVVNLKRFQEQVVSRKEMVEANAPVVFENGVHLPIRSALAKYCPADDAQQQFEAPSELQAFHAQDARNLDLFEDYEDVAIYPQHPAEGPACTGSASSSTDMHGGTSRSPLCRVPNPMTSITPEDDVRGSQDPSPDDLRVLKRFSF